MEAQIPMLVFHFSWIINDSHRNLLGMIFILAQKLNKTKYKTHLTGGSIKWCWIKWCSDLLSALFKRRRWLFAAGHFSKSLKSSYTRVVVASCSITVINNFETKWITPMYVVCQTFASIQWIIREMFLIKIDCLSMWHWIKLLSNFCAFTL